MYPRQAAKELLLVAQQYPVVTLLGPRQSGKTTLVRHVFPHKEYINLEDPDVRLLVEADPRSFLDSIPEGAILDEIQRVPLLLSYIQTMVDEKERKERSKGVFILTGSHQMELHEAIAQSLAGRTALLTLLPMSIEEIVPHFPTFSLEDFLLHGGYPRIFQDHLDPTKAYRNYFQTYIERDLRQLIMVKNLLQFEKFVRLAAGRIGSLLNLEDLGGEVGVSSHTVKEWISILEASFIVFRVSPYFENFGKRLTKSTKLFFYDVGLATYLLGIENVAQMRRDPLRGHLFENLVALEWIKGRLHQGLDPQLYYYRDAQKREVDFIVKRGNDLIPIEVKSSQTFHPSFLYQVRFFQELAGLRAPKGWVIYGGATRQRIGSIELIPYQVVGSLTQNLSD